MTGGSQGAAEADLGAALQHGDDHDVGDPDCADTERNQPHADEETLEPLVDTGPLIANRLNDRAHEFMPPSLLASQFDALERPAAEDDVVVADIELPVADLVAFATARLGRD